MTDLNKERVAFEGKFPKPHWIEWDEELGQYTSKHVSDVGYQARFEVWLEAKAQAVPETQASSITLTCADLKEAFDFGAPDGEKDQFQMETEMTIKWLEDGYDGPGCYCWYADLPEEGCIKLGKSESGASQ